MIAAASIKLPLPIALDDRIAPTKPFPKIGEAFVLIQGLEREVYPAETTKPLSCCLTQEYHRNSVAQGFLAVPITQSES